MNNTRPSFYLISSAVDGNVNAIEKILALYDPYISKCCLRPFYDKYGNVCIVVDMILSILVYTFFSRMFDLMLPPVAKHSIVVA